MPQFDISTFYSQAFWLIATFSFLYVIVSKFVSPVTEQIFKNRKAVIDSAVEQAETMTSQTEILKQEFEAQYKNIVATAENIKKESMNELNKAFTQEITSLSKQLEVKRLESMKELDSKLEGFVSTQSEACLDLANFIIKKITDKDSNLTLLKSCYERVK